MTYAPKSLSDLNAYWQSVGGVGLGIVGNQRHCGGYHLGRDRIFGGCACRDVDGQCVAGKGASDYSVVGTRDREGLTNAASAIDLGKLNGSLENLYAFSEWLVARCLAKAPGTADIREVIYWSVANKRVQRYSGVDGQVHWGPGNGDLSHKTHTHISYFRDSEDRDKRSAFIPYFVDLPDTGTEGAMTPINAGGLTLASSYVVDLRAGTQLYDGPGKPRTPLSSDATVDYFGNPADNSAYAAVLVSTKSGFPDGVARPVLLYVLDADAPAPRPKTEAELTATAARYAECPDVEAARNAGFNDGRDAVLTAGAAVPRK